MTIIVPSDYHVIDILQANQIRCISSKEAQRKDIRELRIGILNIMPLCQNYEFNILHPLGISIIQVEPVWIKLRSHDYKSSDSKHLKKLYVTYEEALQKAPLDGLIVTGAPVERMKFEDVQYWEEISSILKHAKKSISSTLGLCWGAFALAYLEGIDKLHYSKKLFGVFEAYNLIKDHPITGELDDVFLCPQSRYAGIEDHLLEQYQKEGKLNLLCHGYDSGYLVFETPDHRYIMHTGHPEYHSKRLIEEYQRDLLKIPHLPPPQNLDLKRPLNRWKSHRNMFFTQWLKYCYQNI